MLMKSLVFGYKMTDFSLRMNFFVCLKLFLVNILFSCVSTLFAVLSNGIIQNAQGKYNLYIYMIGRANKSF